MSVGSNLKKIRKQRKKTQKEFSNLLGISPSYLSELEHDKRNLNISTIEKIAEKLNVSTNYLMTGEYMLKDIHIMPEQDKERLRNQQKEFYENIRTSSLNSTQTLLDGIDLDSLGTNEIYTLNNFIMFMKNYKNIDDGYLINAMFATFVQLNKLHEEVYNQDLTVEEKNKIIDLYINDLIEESNIFYSKFSSYLKEN